MFAWQTHGFLGAFAFKTVADVSSQGPKAQEMSQKENQQLRRDLHLDGFSQGVALRSNEGPFRNEKTKKSSGCPGIFPVVFSHVLSCLKCL